MNIDKNQLDLSKRKKIGNLNKAPVWELFTKGGLCLIISSGPTTKVLGAAPHRAIARHIAQENEPELFIEELSKSDDLNVGVFQHLIPYWSDVTREISDKLE